MSCLNVSRREQQELFLKAFKYEKRAVITNSRTEDDFRRVQKRIKYLPWLERFAAVMEIELDEEF